MEQAAAGRVQCAPSFCLPEQLAGLGDARSTMRGDERRAGLADRHLEACRCEPVPQLLQSGVGAHPAFPWQLLVGEELLVRMGAAGLTRSGLARQAGLRHKTVTDIYRIDRFRFLSVRTLTVLRAALATRLQVVRSTPP
ncbi:hypothetical protein GCM10009623_34560 [Nocardioides aestuarii]